MNTELYTASAASSPSAPLDNPCVDCASTSFGYDRVLRGGGFRGSDEPDDPGRAGKARRRFFAWRDKTFSFTDCTSFVVMKERRIRVALTSDRHFVQAGFDVAPPP